MAKTYKAVIFDMGGVILRTEDPTPRQELADEFGTKRRELEKFVFMSPTSLQSEIGMISDEEHWKIVLQHFMQTDLTPEEVYDRFFMGDKIDYELLDFAKSLKPQYQIGLLSNAWVNARKHLSKRFDFIEPFDVCIFSSEVGARKPDKEIFLIMLDRLGINPEEAIFIDDLEENVIGAEKVGMTAILFESTKQVIKRVKSILKI